MLIKQHFPHESLFGLRSAIPRTTFAYVERIMGYGSLLPPASVGFYPNGWSTTRA